MKLLDFLPREDKFYHMLEGLAEKAVVSSQLLQQLVSASSPEAIQTIGQQITQNKAEAKKISQTITAEVCRTFITPFDREDIQAFAADLYKIVKVIEKIQDRMIHHHLRPVRQDFNRQVDIVARQASALSEVIKELSTNRNSKAIFEKSAVLHELEDQGDQILSQLLVESFSQTEDVRDLILRKDVYEMLERVINYYRDAANVALQIILKHS